MKTLIFLTVFVLVMLGIWRAVDSDSMEASLNFTKNMATCSFRGGSIITKDSELRCNLKYEDGGLSCNSSAECEGLCVVSNPGQVGRQGICQFVSEPDNCQIEITEPDNACSQRITPGLLQQ